MFEKRAYQVDRARIGPHGETVNVLRLEIAGNGSPYPGRDLVIRWSLVRHPARLEVPGRDARAHLVHPQRLRHQWENSPMMNGREDKSGGQAFHTQLLQGVEEGVEPPSIPF